MVSWSAMIYHIESSVWIFNLCNGTVFGQDTFGVLNVNDELHIE